MKNRTVKSAYEKRISHLLTTATIVMCICLGCMLIFSWIVLAVWGDLGAIILTVICSTLAFVLLPLYVLLSVPTLKKEKSESVAFYKNFCEESIFTTFDVSITKDNVTRKIHKPVRMDRNGFKNADYEIYWQAYNVKVIDGGLTNALEYKLQLVSKDEKTVIEIMPKHKAFYLFKNYCPLTVNEMDKVEKWLLKREKIDFKNVDYKDFSKIAVKIKTHYILIIFAVGFGFMAVAGILMALALINTVLLVIAILLGALLALLFEAVITSLCTDLPVGTVYLSGKQIYYKAFKKSASINADEVKIVFDDYKIIFKSELDAFSVFNTAKNRTKINRFLGREGNEKIEINHFIYCKFLNKDIASDYCECIKATRAGRIQNHFTFEIAEDRCKKTCDVCPHNFVSNEKKQ